MRALINNARDLRVTALAALTVFFVALAAAAPASAYQLLVGTHSGEGDYGTGEGGKVYRYDGNTGVWTDLTPPAGVGFAVMDLIVYDGRLYAATQKLGGYADEDDVFGEVLRYEGGTTWTVVGEFDYPAMAMVEYRDDLYAATSGYPDDDPPGANLYRYDGTPNDWTLAAHDEEPDGHGTGFFSATVSSLSGTDEIVLGDFNTDRWNTYSPETGLIFRQDEGGSCVWDFAEYGGLLYSGHWWGPIFATADARIWNYVLEDPDRHFWALEPFQGQLYFGSSGDTDLSGFYESGRLDTLDVTTPALNTLWEYGTDDYADGITTLAARRDESLMFIGTGFRHGYYVGDADDGLAEVYVYDGSTLPPTRISSTDQFVGGVLSMLIVEEVPVDIKPGSCPNPFNTKAKGVLPVAIAGTAEIGAAEIDPASVRLMGVAPLRWSMEDVTRPHYPGDPPDAEDCITEGADGEMDLSVKFDRQEILAAVQAALGRDVVDGEVLKLSLTAELTDGTPVTGEDVVLILKKGK